MIRLVVSFLLQVPKLIVFMVMACYPFFVVFIFRVGFNAGVKLKEARQSAGTFVGEVAKDARGNVADVAERVGSLVKSRWAFLQHPSTKHAVQERLISAAATTGTLFRKGFSETKEKVVVGKIKVEEVILLPMLGELDVIYKYFPI